MTGSGAVPATTLVRAAAARLHAAGRPSARADAEQLVAHVLGVPRARLLLTTVDTATATATGDTGDTGDTDGAATLGRLEALVARRAGGEPLQHLLGTAVLGRAEVAVGRGVFVPRPETELLLTHAVAVLAGVERPRVVDLCTGSGALALAIALERPDAQVHAVEVDPAALAWARRNVRDTVVGGTAVVLHDADVTRPGVLGALDGTVDLVVANPPYVPDGAPVADEVRHDPARAVFAGPDGLALIDPLARLAARLLRPAGHLGVEHDETHAAGVRERVAAAGFADVATRADLAGRDRITVARRSPTDRRS